MHPPEKIDLIPALDAPRRDHAQRLRDTQEAFDRVAADYDGARGNNELIQDMRREMWSWLDSTFASPRRLIDLGCGTGLDAVRMARRGHTVTATDWSAEMVGRTRCRAQAEQVSERVQALAIGSHELERLSGSHAYDGAYSNLGPLNCVPDLRAVSRECARLLRPGGALVFTVIGRVCPWEIAHYLRRGRFGRATIRFKRGAVPVALNRRTIWTRYFTPQAFAAEFAANFTVRHIRGLCLFAPPPYLTWVREQYPAWYERLWRWDRRVSGWPGLRQMGDHFLIVLDKK